MEKMTHIEYPIITFYKCQATYHCFNIPFKHVFYTAIAITKSFNQLKALVQCFPTTAAQTL